MFEIHPSNCPVHQRNFAIYKYKFRHIEKADRSKLYKVGNEYLFPNYQCWFSRLSVWHVNILVENYSKSIAKALLQVLRSCTKPSSDYHVITQQRWCDDSPEFNTNRQSCIKITCVLIALCLRGSPTVMTMVDTLSVGVVNNIWQGL